MKRLATGLLLLAFMVGPAAAETRFVAMLPHDDVPEPGWLEALHGVLAAAPKAI